MRSIPKWLGILTLLCISELGCSGSTPPPAATVADATQPENSPSQPPAEAVPASDDPAETPKPMSAEQSTEPQPDAAEPSKDSTAETTVATSPPSDSPDSDSAGTSDPELAGEWYCVSATYDGRPDPTMANASITLKNNSLEVHSRDGSQSGFTFVTNAQADPKTIDLTIKKGDQEMTLLCIYRITGTKLEIFMEGPMQTRPKDFSNDRSVMTLERGESPVKAEPVAEEPMVEVKNIEPNFTTAEEAYETYRLAMKHHSWGTAFEAYLPEYQGSYLYYALAKISGRPGKNASATQEQFDQEREDLLARHGLQGFKFRTAAGERMVREVKDAQATFVEVMQFQKKFGLLDPASRWDEMKDITVRQDEDAVVCEYKISIPGEGMVPMATVFEKSGDKWGMSFEKSFTVSLQLRSQASAAKREAEAPATEEPVVEVKNIEPNFATAEEAFETYRLAMKHHHWATAFEAYLPASQDFNLCLLISEKGFRLSRDASKSEQFKQERKELLARYGLQEFERGITPADLPGVSKLKDLKDKQACFADALQLHQKFGLLSDPSRWDLMKEVTVRQKDESVICEFKVKKVREGVFVSEVMVFEKQGDNWGINTAKSMEAYIEMRDKAQAAKNKPADDAPAAVATESPDGFRTWTTADGKFKVQAKFRSLINNKVAQLEKADGTISKVPLAKLSEADQQFISENAKE